MFKGLIESESLKDQTILKKLHAVQSHQEHHPGQNTEVVTVYKVQIPDNKIKSTINTISDQYIKPDWYALFWNEKTVFVVFQNKIFMLKNITPWDAQEIEIFAKYAMMHGIMKKHIDNLRQTMAEF
jgi:hypothetical protein